jgi:hypothetical protein
VLLSSDFLFANHSDEYYPHADTLVTYLEHYAQHFALNVHYQHDVVAVYRLGKAHIPRPSPEELRHMPPHQRVRFTIEAIRRGENSASYGNDASRYAQYSCQTVISATGLSKSRTHRVTGIELTENYENVSTDVANFRGQNVLIIGAGNAAFETANAISGVTAVTHIAHRSRLRFSYETHYVGTCCVYACILLSMCVTRLARVVSFALLLRVLCSWWRRRHYRVSSTSRFIP